MNVLQGQTGTINVDIAGEPRRSLLNIGYARLKRHDVQQPRIVYPALGRDPCRSPGVTHESSVSCRQQTRKPGAMHRLLVSRLLRWIKTKAPVGC